jgi:hypothetical protein
MATRLTIFRSGKFRDESNKIEVSLNRVSLSKPYEMQNSTSNQMHMMNPVE